MGKLREMNKKGDVKISWDKSNAKEVAIAKDVFYKHIKNGGFAFRPDNRGKKGQRIIEFESDADEIILAPQLVAG